MKKKNLKDIISNVCGYVLLISGSVLAISTAGVALPAVVVTYATIGATASAAVLAHLMGKNPDLSTKTPEQINNQLNPKP